MAIKPKFNIVVYLVGQWETFHRHPMLEALAKNMEGVTNFLIVNPPVSPGGEFLRGHAFQAWKCLYGERVRKIGSNLWVLTPSLPVLAPLNRLLPSPTRAPVVLSNQIKDALDQISNAEHTLAWVYRPEQISLSGLINEDFLVYECYDEYCYSVLDFSPNPTVIEQENHLLQKASVVFTTSEALFESRRLRHPRVYYTPNGCEWELFSKALDPLQRIPKDLQAIPGKRIGYIGNIAHHLDFEIIEQILQKDASWSFVYIGELGKATLQRDAQILLPKIQRLQRFPNFYLLGWRNHDDLPHYIKGLEVLTLPHLMNHHNQHRNSNKFWDYLATGKPVVATNSCPEVQKAKAAVFLANTPKEFIDSVQLALNPTSKEPITTALRLAEENSWERRTRETAMILAALYQGKFAKEVAAFETHGK